jgi:hypothetical protein
VDWGKVDAPLASALAGASAEEPLSVFVQIDRSRGDVDRDVLDRLGLDPEPAEVSTATLSPSQLDALTDEEWVLYVRLSGQLRLLRRPEAPSPSPALAPAGDKQPAANQKDRRPKQVKRKPRTT